MIDLVNNMAWQTGPGSPTGTQLSTQTQFLLSTFEKFETFKILLYKLSNQTWTDFFKHFNHSNNLKADKSLFVK